jgi:hypothetical protein
VPIPTPSPTQSKDNFLTACMDDATMLSEYPDAPQRYAVCLAQWDGSRGVETKPTTSMGWPVSPF